MNTTNTTTPAYLSFEQDILDNLYDLRKAQDASRYLILRAVGLNGLMSTDTLGGLLYLAEREFFQRYAEPLIGDILVRTDNSNMVTFTLQKTQAWLKGQESGGEGVVDIQPDMSLKVVFPQSHIQQDTHISPEQHFFKCDTHLSDADIEVLDFILFNFIHMNAQELSSYIYHQCAETNTLKEDGTIAHTSLLQALGYDANQIDGILDHMEEIASLNMAFNR